MAGPSGAVPHKLLFIYLFIYIYFFSRSSHRHAMDSVGRDGGYREVVYVRRLIVKALGSIVKALGSGSPRLRVRIPVRSASCSSHSSLCLRAVGSVSCPWDVYNPVLRFLLVFLR